MRRGRTDALVVMLVALSLGASACGARFARPSASAGGQGAVAGADGLTQGDAGSSGAGGGLGTAGSGTGGGGTGSALPGGAGGAGTTGALVPGGSPGGGSTGGATTAGSTGSGGGGTSGSTGASGTSGGTSGGSGAPVPPGPRPGVTDTGINVGYLIPKTGAAPLPPQVEDGIKAYWTFLNGKGGVYGRKVTVTTYDTTSTDSGARTAAQQAVDAGDFLIVALDRLGVQGTIAKYLEGRHVPNIEVQTPVDLPASMSWTFGVTIDHRVQGTLIADYMAHALKVHRVGVVYETDSTLQPGVDAFTKEAKAQGLAVVHSQQVNGMDNQFLAEAQKLAADKAEATWLYMAPTPAANIAKESESDGYKPIWFANSISWNFNIGLTGGGTSTVHARAFSPWPALGDPRLSTYNGYAPSGPPSVQDFGIPGWGIGQIVANALLDAGKDLGQNGFRNAMQNLRLTTKSPVDGTPLLWSPLSFHAGSRTGATDVITFAQKGSGTGTDTQWAGEADYRSSY